MAAAKEKKENASIEQKQHQLELREIGIEEKEMVCNGFLFI